ncbi:MAG: response regulator, partial [Pseudomonadota bacterium]|nr:response regulator [Pseudomonadota bacterium]
MSQPRILVIDDSVANLAFLQYLLGQHHFEVIVANTGKSGLALAKQTAPDIILLDVIMPDWDGYETWYHIKQEVDLKEIPILFLSARDPTLQMRERFAIQTVDYICKPFQEAELLNRLKAYIAHNTRGQKRPTSV